MKTQRSKSEIFFSILILAGLFFILLTGANRSKNHPEPQSNKGDIEIAYEHPESFDVRPTSDLDALIFDAYLSTPTTVEKYCSMVNSVDSYRLIFDDVEIFVTHYLPTDNQVEDWEYFVFDANGDMLDAMHLAYETQHRIRAMCIKVDK